MKRFAQLFGLVAGLCAGNLPGADTRLDLFIAGTGGYAVYRIPALVMTPQRTLLAACEARATGKGDWDQIDILTRRSTDGGQTWEPARELAGRHRLPADLERNRVAVAAGLGREGAFTFNNPTWIADPATGETHLLYCAEYARAFIITTRDGGTTFSEPREITGAFAGFRTRDRYAWQVIAIGPGHGVRLSAGRLVAAVWLSTGEGGHAHRPSACATIYSDDRGVTWHAGEIIARDPDPLANPSETAVVETEPGRVLVAIRSESPRHRRAIATSPDGAAHWSVLEFLEELWEPVCMAGLTRVEPTGPSKPAILLFSHPASLDRNPDLPADSMGLQRKNLTVRASLDGGRSWPLSRSVEPGRSAYSDLAVGADGTVYCLYERGQAGPYEKLTLVRFPVAQLVPASR